jgi:hypothetical protein
VGSRDQDHRSPEEWNWCKGVLRAKAYSIGFTAGRQATLHWLAGMRNEVEIRHIMRLAEVGVGWV